DAARDRVTVEYLASIQQMSGEDWGDVQTTLSTATPSLVAKAPVLNELAISLSKPGQAGDGGVLAQIAQSGSAQAREDLKLQRQELENFRGTFGATADASGSGGNYININGTQINIDYIGDNNDLDLILNKTASDLQMVDLLAS